MKILSLGSVAIASVLSLGCAKPVGRHVQQVERAAFVNVAIIDPLSGTSLPDRTVRVENGVIREIAQGAMAVSSNTRIIDGRGKFLIPGLADMHVHHYEHAVESPYGDDDQLLYLVNGVTTVRNVGGSPRDLEARRRIEAGKLVGPRYFTCGPMLGGWVDVEEAEEKVAQQARAGYDCIKIYSGVTKPAFRKLIATARRLGISAVGHPQLRLGLGETLELKSIEHLEESLRFFRPPALTHPDNEAVARQLAEHGVFVTPTLTMMAALPRYLSAASRRQMQSSPETAFVSAVWFEKVTEDVEEFIKPLRKLGVERLERDRRRSLEVAGFLHSRGVRLLLGTDSAGFDPPGFAVHRELELLVAAGLTPAESLQTGTSNVADYFGPAYRGGRIEVGRSADIVLLDANPLEDIRNSRKISGVMVGRWWIDAPTRTAILEELRRR